MFLSILTTACLHSVGVDADADARTIKLAYRKMALQFRKYLLFLSTYVAPDRASNISPLDDAQPLSFQILISGRVTATTA